MAVDVNSLTIDNITPEIMAQMGPSEIAAFKAKLTPEQMQSLADKFGGSQAAPPEDENPPVQTATQTNFVVTQAEASAPAPTPTPSGSDKPMEQKGPVVFGRR